MFKTAKAKKRRFSDVLNVFKRFSNNSKTPPSKIEHKNEIARKTEDFLIFRAIFLTLQFLFTFLFLSHSTQNITHFRRFLPLPIQFHPFPPFSTFLRFPCQLTPAPLSGEPYAIKLNHPNCPHPKTAVCRSDCPHRGAGAADSRCALSFDMLTVPESGFCPGRCRP